jgi:hypothetical protein
MKQPSSSERVPSEASALTGLGHASLASDNHSDIRSPETGAGGEREGGVQPNAVGADGECCALLRRKRTVVPTPQVRPVGDR